jgi:hypothetical protein
MTLQNAPSGLGYDSDRRFLKVCLILSLIIGFGVWIIYVVAKLRYTIIYCLPFSDEFSSAIRHLNTWLQCAW